MRLGKVFFQSHGREDVFLSVDLRGDGVVKTLGSLLSLPGLNASNKAWINGEQPTRHEVNVQNTQGLLHCWLKTENFSSPFTVRIYLELELVEELASESDVEHVERIGKPEYPCQYNDRCLLETELNTS
jgi:hypothetical protein